MKHAFYNRRPYKLRWSQPSGRAFTYCVEDLQPKTLWNFKAADSPVCVCGGGEVISYISNKLNECSASDEAASVPCSQKDVLKVRQRRLWRTLFALTEIKMCGALWKFTRDCEYYCIRSQHVALRDCRPREILNKLWRQIYRGWQYRDLYTF